ncbi:MAG: PIN domain-containing protein [Candidatus Dojkabacteria bacterium]|nr:PIN domain-containing protein [Candidatus Dojkabacteria bacterium]
MKKTILVDSSVIIDYLKTGKGLLPIAYENYNLAITASIVTEIFASKTLEDNSLSSEVREFIEKYFIVLDIDQEIAEKAGEILRRSNVTMAVALLAATAIIKKYDILTSNQRDFDGIQGVSFVNI